MKHKENKETTGFRSEELARLRQEFPMLNRQFNGKKLIYFNSAATALKPKVVIEKITEYYQDYGVNVFRGVDSVSYLATKAFEETREKVAQFIGAQSDREIVFTRGTTSALNLVANAYGKTHITQEDEIVVNMGEHHANFIPWQQLAKQTGAKLVFAPLTKQGELTAENLRTVMNKRTKLVACAHISNVMGAVQDLKALAKVVHEYGAVFVVDGAQGIVHERPEVASWDIDFYAFSGHKIYGPTGVGVLYGKSNLLAEMPPVEYGGEMIDVVKQYDTTFADPPARFEAGTPMIAEVIGLSTALSFVDSISYEAMQAQVSFLAERLAKGLSALEGVVVYNGGNAQSGVVTFNIEGVHAHDAASTFDREGISLRAGQHCNQPTMDFLGQQAVLRASLSFFNTTEEVDFFIEIAKKAGNFLDALF